MQSFAGEEPRTSSQLESSGSSSAAAVSERAAALIQNVTQTSFTASHMEANMTQT